MAEARFAHLNTSSLTRFGDPGYRIPRGGLFLPFLLGLSALWPSPPATAATGTAADAIAEGDARYAARAAGAKGSVADPAAVDGAIAAYSRGLGLAPGDLAARYKLLRALHYRGAFCGATLDEQKRIFDEGRRLGQEAVDRLEKMAGTARGAQRIAALRREPHAAELYFWTAACWGQWALARGKLAAARVGVSGRVRDLAQTVLDLDPQLEDAGAHRILGRLHDQSPRIPLLTGWVSKRSAVEHLRQAHAIAPTNAIGQFFLAEALLEHEPAHAEEARRLLAQCATQPPRPEYLVEDRHYAELARARLEALGNFR